MCWRLPWGLSAPLCVPWLLLEQFLYLFHDIPIERLLGIESLWGSWWAHGFGCKELNFSFIKNIKESEDAVI